MQRNGYFFHSLSTLFIYVLFVFISSYQISGQSRSFAGLPQLKPKKHVDYIDNLNQTEDYDHILKIYERLVEAKGDKRMPVPQLNLRNEEGYVASMDYRLLDISLEKKAYDIAKKYGDEAIAFLLAHELIHHYEKHGWRNQFSDEVSDMETGKLLALIDDGVANEVQADVLGGFLAYSAGYGIFDKGDVLINDLYQSYAMKDKISGYPSKKDRIELAKRNKTQIERLAAIFEAASYLTIIGKYDQAYTYYGYLLNRYQSRELYNNAGLTCLLAAVSKIEPKLMRFEYPLFFDIEFTGSARNTDQVVEAQKLLNEATTHFETAILMNPKVLTSYINKVSCYIIGHLLGNDSDQKNSLLAKAKYVIDIEIPSIIAQNDAISYNSYTNQIAILNSIISFYDNNLDLAKSLLKEPIADGNEIAQRNLNALNGIIENNVQATLEIEAIDFQIDGMSAQKFLEQRLVAKNITRINDKVNFRFINIPTSNYQVLRHESMGDDQNFGFDIAFLSNKDSYTGEVLPNLKMGQSKADFISKLGSPLKTYSHLNGEILLFKNNKLLITNQNNFVVKIIDYYESVK
jgi:hypothetical protein